MSSYLQHLDPLYRNRVIDIRYSMVPNEVQPLWSLELRPGAARAAHAVYQVHRDAGADSAARVWAMLTGS